MNILNTLINRVGKYNLLLIGLLLFHTVIYIIFRYLHVAPQTWDSAGHMSLSVKFAELYKDLFSNGDASLYTILTTSFYYPPLLHMITAVFLLIFGYSSQLQLAIMFLMFLLTVVLTYKVVIELKFDSKVAFFSAFFYSLFPFVIDQARLFHTEMPMIVLILLGYLFLIRSDRLLKKRYVIAFFIVLALGQLVRWYALLYSVVPFLYLVYLTLIVDKKHKEVLPQLILGSIIFFAVALPWYILNWRVMKLIIGWYAEGESDDPQVLLSIQNIIYYFRALIANQNLLVSALAAISGLVLFIKNNKRNGLLLLAHILLIYLTFTIITNKNGRYIIGLQMILGFLISYLIVTINKKYLTAFIIGTALLGFFFISFNKLDKYSIDSKYFGMIFAGPFYSDIYADPQMFSYKDTVDPIELVLTFIQNDAKSAQIKPIGVASLVDQNTFSAANQELIRANLDFEDIYFSTPYFKDEKFSSDYALIKYLRDRNVSYLLVPNEPGPQNQKNYHVLIQAIEFANTKGDVWFDKVGSFNISDNELVVYRKKRFNDEFLVDNCKEFVGLTSERIAVSVDPLASLIIFTSKYNYNDMRKEVAPNTLRVLEVNNSSVESKTITVTNLPQEGVSVCHRLGTEVKLQKEIYEAFKEENNACGEVCTSVIHTKIDGSKVDQVIYNRDEYLGNALVRGLKNIKVLPNYIEPYSLKRDIINEFEGRF